MKRKIYIFLDVDGVLNNINFWKKNYFKYGFSAGTYSIDEKNIKTLAKLHRKLKDKYELHYVLSSTWRLSKDGQAVILNRLRDNGIKLDGITEPNNSEDRGKLILNYLNNLQSYDLAIAMDDDTFDINPYLTENFHLVAPDFHTGLTCYETRLIRKIIKEIEKKWKKREKEF